MVEEYHITYLAVLHSYRALNVDQQQAFDVISQGHNAFVTGNAGSSITPPRWRGK